MAYKILHISQATAKPVPKDFATVEIRSAAWYANDSGENDFFVSTAIDPATANDRRLPTELTLVSVLGEVDPSAPAESILGLDPAIAPRVAVATGGAPGNFTLVLPGASIPDNNERRFVTIGKF